MSGELERQKSSQATQDRFPPVLIMYHPSMQSLAENLVRRVQEEYLAQKVSSSSLLHDARVAIPSVHACREKLLAATGVWSCGRRSRGAGSEMAGPTSSLTVWRPLQGETVSV